MKEMQIFEPALCCETGICGASVDPELLRITTVIDRLKQNGIIVKRFNYIIFDTAPTWHTLRMLQLPSAWSNFISESTHGASCLGQLSGHESKKAIYRQAVETLADGVLTTLILVTRPENAPLKEAERASKELSDIGIRNQMLLINGVLTSHNDSVSDSLYFKQQNALADMPETLRTLETCFIPLRAYNVAGIEKRQGIA